MHNQDFFKHRRRIAYLSFAVTVVTIGLMFGIALTLPAAIAIVDSFSAIIIAFLSGCFSIVLAYFGSSGLDDWKKK